VREVPTWPADLPDALVGLLPSRLEPVDEPAGEAPGIVRRRESLSARLIEGVDDLAVDVELPLPRCAVPDPNGPGALVSVEPAELDLRQAPLAGRRPYMIWRSSGDPAIARRSQSRHAPASSTYPPRMSARRVSVASRSQQKR
jgi:hypothetical protein